MIQEPFSYPQFVSSLTKKGLDILPTFSVNKIDLVHAIMGISGEAGELLDTFKRHTMYNQPIDRENVIEELGDLEFYMERLRSCLDITREETIEYNMTKLTKRYSQGYTDEAAKERADKK